MSALLAYSSTLPTWNYKKFHFNKNHCKKKKSLQVSNYTESILPILRVLLKLEVFLCNGFVKLAISLLSTRELSNLLFSVPKKFTTNSQNT